MIIQFVLLLFCNLQAAVNPKIVYENNQAVKLYQEEKVLDSQKFLQKKIVDSPQEGVLHYNLGVANEAAQESDKAFQEYLSAAKHSQDGELQFKAFFNAARIFGEKQDFKSALKYYQLALEIKPDSEEVKTNIELLFQGGGGGSNQSEKEQDKKDEKQQKQDQQKQSNPEQQDKNQSKPKPKPFKSEDLTEQDVKKILEELKRQEEQIRAKINNQKSKETPVDKDW